MALENEQPVFAQGALCRQVDRRAWRPRFVPKPVCQQATKVLPTSDSRCSRLLKMTRRLANGEPDAVSDGRLCRVRARPDP